MMMKKILLITLMLGVLSLILMACSPVEAVEAEAISRKGPQGDSVNAPAEGSRQGGQESGSGQQGTGRGRNDTGQMNAPQDGNGAGGGNALSALSAEEADGLIRAIEEEYTARALYESVMGTYGETSPFAEIAASEMKHAESLIRQAEKYGLDVPEYEAVEFPAFSSLEEACQAGVDAEIVDAALYDELMAFTNRSDLVRVYTNLQKASLDNHLPEFETCN